jgi:hypothetical protein
MKSGMKLLLVAAAVSVAGIANACNDDGHRSVAAPRGGLSEASRISGSSRLAISALVPSASAALQSPSLAMAAAPPVTTPFEARVTRGNAVADSVGLVATTHTLRATRRSSAFTDRDGHRNELVLDADAADQPVRRLQHFRDGQLLADVAFDWERTAGGWMLKDRTTTIHVGGRPVLRVHRSLEGLEIARNGQVSTLSGLASAGFAAFGPARLEAQLMACIGPNIMVGVTGALAVFTGIALVEHPSLILLAAFVAAVTAYEGALDQFILCMME